MLFFRDYQDSEKDIWGQIGYPIAGLQEDFDRYFSE